MYLDYSALEVLRLGRACLPALRNVLELAELVRRRRGGLRRRRI